MFNEIIGSNSYFFVRPVSFEGYGIYEQEGIDKARVVATYKTHDEAEKVLQDNLLIRLEMQKEALRRMNKLGIERRVINHFANGFPMMFENGEFKELSNNQLAKIRKIQCAMGMKIYLLKKCGDKCEMYYVSAIPMFWEEETKTQRLWR